MGLLMCLCGSLAFTLAFRTPLMRWPFVFYGAAIVVDIVFVSGLLSQVAPEAARALLPCLRRCMAPYGLFTVVMFVGILPEGSRIRSYLRPVRGNLSVLAALLSLSHIVSYARVYLGVALEGFVTASLATAASLVLSMILVILLAVLTVTSFGFVRRVMHAVSWLRVQRLAYIFFGLVSVHAILLLLPSCLAGAQSAAPVVAYVATLFLYATLRLARWIVDKRGMRSGMLAHAGAAALRNQHGLRS